jgi:hypothetical protein
MCFYYEPPRSVKLKTPLGGIKLCPDEKNRDARWQDRTNRFSEAQRAAVAAFLRWLKSLDDPELFETDFLGHVPQLWR